jgi:hypothetical protein
MRFLFTLLSVLAVSGHSGQELTGKKVALLCQVTDRAYDDGWKTIRLTRVFADGTYEMTDTNPWRAEKAAQQFRGTVPESVRQTLQLSAHDPKVFRPQEGVPTYEVCIDDWRTRHPKAVKTLERFLDEQHGPK